MLAWQIALLALVAAPLGLLTGAYGWSLALVLGGYLGWVLWDLLRLWRWLGNAQPDAEPPVSGGLCGALFDRLHDRQRRQLEHQKRLQQIIDRGRESVAAFSEAVIFLDASANLEWWNPAAERLLGLRQDKDLGHPITYVLRHPHFREYFQRADHYQPLDMVSPLDPGVQLQLSITRFGDDERLLLVRDVTHIQQLQQMRKDFVANVSHELRTPLTVISGYLETLLDNNGVDPRWQRAVQQMQQQASRMQTLLTDLLLLSRLEIGDSPADPGPVVVARLLRMIVADAQVISAKQRHRISVQADSGLDLRGSESELRSAFSNLVLNAVKYTPAGGDIRIRWFSADDGGARLEVIDSGPGIDAHHLPRLTERFYRVDYSRSISTGGTGLGLAIVKHVLQRHGGHLEIRSQVGQGSNFICCFPKGQLIEKD